MRRIWKFVLTAAICTTALTAGQKSFSQSEGGNDPLAPDMEVIDTMIFKEKDAYILPTVENLSKLYWVIGKLDLNDSEAIDNYLRINECQLYQQYFHNDFEWDNIRLATKEYLQENMAGFPTKFEMTTAISLGRYDIENEEFVIDEESQILGMRRIDFTLNDEAVKETCGIRGSVNQYPANMIVVLNRPLIIEKIPVQREVAELYIEEAKSFYENLPLRLQLEQYQRVAFLRLKIWVSQYKNTVTTPRGDKRAVVFGRLDGYEVYADSKQTKPLFYQDLSDDRFKRIKERKTRLNRNKEQQEDLNDLRAE